MGNMFGLPQEEALINYWFPEGSQGGFYFGGPDPTVPELSHGGELWVPRNFTVETHTHDCWEFHLQITTGMRWNAAGRTFTLKAGDLSPSLRTCRTASTPAWKRSSTTIGPAFFSRNCRLRFPI